jgi:hypothetical protein
MVPMVQMTAVSDGTSSCEEAARAMPSQDERAQTFDRDDALQDPSLALAEVTDRTIRFLMSRMTLGLSPMALAQAYFDWLAHLAVSPGKQLQLWHKGARKGARLAVHLAHCAAQGGIREPCISPLPQDMALQYHLPSFSAATAVVAQRGDRRARRHRAPRARARLHLPTDARRLLSLQFHPD